MTRKLAVLLLTVCVVAGTATAGGRAKAISRVDLLDAERRLEELGYWLSRADGLWDATSRHALVAFQKVEGLEPTGRLSKAVLERLRSAERPRPFEAGPAHVEIDVARQVLFLVEDGGVVGRILPVSTGNDERMRIAGVSDWAYTPRGRFAVRNKVAGWRRSELGLLYYPSYILGGIAIHGNPEVPAKPASHGCIRVPMFAAKRLAELLPVGMPVIVHDSGSLANIPAHIRKQSQNALVSTR